MAISRDDLMKQLLPGMNKVFEEAYGKYRVPHYPIHMKAKGRWQLLEWNEELKKYKVKAEYPTHKEALGIKKLLQEN